ncbi:HesA/MoeB/ThiF family protein [Vibrio genomosp. F10]|uniref:HesA/MoeB/ThiF family protein n=1 Tax=Vibrio genomosp. F10 TaxID=723171 RepID=UPI0003007359|nr:HesA/MoeB/ThiF family protein [Vibrio genomosp. F10]OEF07093.1 molybdopterin-synthase adenylyltransferase MoeB [Vibrio genomosp. F10 str. 9ZB36]
MLTDREFLNYHRQICLPDFLEEGQLNLKNSRILLLGCGGLGSAAALYLVGAGVGQLVIVDDDVVEKSNLQRQVAYRERDIASNKSSAMKRQLLSLNSDCSIRAITERLGEEQLSNEVAASDVILDCTDSFESRHLINQVCFQQGKPLISGAAIGWQGQFIVFDFPNASPCYQCLYPKQDVSESRRCADMGIIGPVVGTVGNLQALAAIQKLALGRFECPTQQLKLFDGKTFHWQSLTLEKDTSCTVCGQESTNPNGTTDCVIAKEVTL